MMPRRIVKSARLLEILKEILLADEPSSPHHMSLQENTRALNNPSTSKDFIIADAKDADMAFGVTAPGPQTASCRHGYNESEGAWKTLEQYLEQICERLNARICRTEN